MRPANLCKVCSAVVPRRKDHAPKICEACQKFFRRQCQANDKVLVCARKTRNCLVDVRNRRMCKRCRHDKCIAVGMQSKYMRRPQNAENDFMENLSSKSSECSLSLQLVQDPIIFDGTEIEDLIKNCTIAFTCMHEANFLPLSNPAALHSWCDIETLGRGQLEGGFASTQSYCKVLVESVGLQVEELDELKADYMIQIGAVYHALPNGNANSFFGVPYLLRLVPDIQNLLMPAKAIERELASWDPPFFIASVLIALIVFSEKSNSNHRLARIRRMLLTALELLASQRSGGNSEAVDEIRNRYQIVVSALKHLTTSMGQTALSMFLCHREMPLAVFLKDLFRNNNYDTHTGILRLSA